MKKILAFILISITLGCSKQLPIEEYRTEVSSLKTEQEIDVYWQKLYRLDQDVLMGMEHTVNEFDSISISNMLRTAFMFEIHGVNSYDSNNFVPVLNLIHNYNGESNLAFWPIILECVKSGGSIKITGGGYPAYQLEGIASTFYGYSLLNQDSKYPKLIEKLKNIETTNTVSQNLNLAFKNQKKRNELAEMEVLDNWTIQFFKNLKEENFFEFVKMSDNNLYIRRYNRIQKLILISSNKDSKRYRVEYEPFGWTFEYKNNGELSLLNDQDEVLINYSTHI